MAREHETGGYPVGRARTPRPRGRPRTVIDLTELLDAVERLFSAGGLDGVSIERAAAELGVSRATLYRTVPSKERLLGLLFKRMTDEVTAEALGATKDDGRSAKARLYALLRVQFDAAIRMRDYMFVFFGREWLEPDVYADWRRWSREYEQIWVDAVRAAADEGALSVKDPVIATRLLLGMILWVSRWYRPNMGLDADDLTDEAIRLLGGELP
jgi:AcrR family transcriptional regulator